jgi:pyrimidine-nucleoside phosphorylase
MTFEKDEGARLLMQLAKGQMLDGLDVSRFMHAAICSDIGPEQLGAFLMGVACRGLSRAARTALTQSYYASDAKLIGSSDADSRFFDKHSTGGVGDKLTFVALPLAAAAGVRVRKLSGSSLAHCRGTIDKLSALPGFRHIDQLEEMTREADRFGFTIGRTSPELCAGDNLTYSMRNLCGGAEVPDLIAASIMSKKLVLKPRGLVLDVKLGRGGLFADRSSARQTAVCMIEIAEDFGLPARAYLTEMETPLGRTVGGLAEIREAMDILSGEILQSDLANLARVFASTLVQMERGVSLVEADRVVEKGWRSGQAYERLVSWLEHRGVNVAAIGKVEISMAVFTAPRGGWIADIDARMVGAFSAELSRTHGMGDVEFLRSVGDEVEKGAPIARIAVSSQDAAAAMAQFGKAFKFETTAPSRPTVAVEVIETARRERVALKC